MLEPLAICQGVMGLRTWLTEIQYLMAKLKQRSFSGMPMYVQFLLYHHHPHLLVGLEVGWARLYLR